MELSTALSTTVRQERTVHLRLWRAATSAVHVPAEAIAQVREEKREKVARERELSKFGGTE